MTDELYDKHAACLMSYLRGRHPIHDAENLFQATWLKVAKSYHAKVDSYSKNWIFSIAKNTEKDFWRKKKEKLGAAEGLGNKVLARQEDALTQLERKEEYEIFKNCKEKLEEPDLSIIEDRMQHVQQAATAARFNKSVPWVSNRAAAAIQRISLCIEQHEAPT